MTQTQNPYPELDDARYEELIHSPHTKSRFSNGNGGCVTLAPDSTGEYVSIQDDKLAPEERLARAQVYTRAEIRALGLAFKAGDYDHLM